METQGHLIGELHAARRALIDERLDTVWERFRHTWAVLAGRIENKYGRGNGARVLRDEFWRAAEDKEECTGDLTFEGNVHVVAAWRKIVPLNRALWRLATRVTVANGSDLGLQQVPRPEELMGLFWRAEGK